MQLWWKPWYPMSIFEYCTATTGRVWLCSLLARHLYPGYLQWEFQKKTISVLSSPLERNNNEKMKQTCLPYEPVHIFMNWIILPCTHLCENYSSCKVVSTSYWRFWFKNTLLLFFTLYLSRFGGWTLDLDHFCARTLENQISGKNKGNW